MIPRLCVHYTLYRSKVICAIVANQCLLKDNINIGI